MPQALPAHSAQARAIAALCVLAAFRLSAAAGHAQQPAAGMIDVRTFNGAHSEIVRFADPRLRPVRIIRGIAPSGLSLPLERKVEIVTFGSGRAESVTVVRGVPPTVPSATGTAVVGNTRLLGPRINGTAMVRGVTLRNDDFALFGPADGGELDRLAFAVDGVESRHGADPRMWRDDLNGPQGPMQVSAAAALDVGGGNRFDLHENRVLGRAYLAQMFRRYGNWPDALAAYNWGPGNLDSWITAGRPSETLPYGVMRYIQLVLRAALVSAPSW